MDWLAVLGSAINLYFVTNNVLYCCMGARACLQISPEKIDSSKISHRCSWAREGAQPQNLVRQLTIFSIVITAKPKGKGTFLRVWENKPCSWAVPRLWKKLFILLTFAGEEAAGATGDPRQIGGGGEKGETSGRRWARGQRIRSTHGNGLLSLEGLMLAMCLNSPPIHKGFILAG